MAGPLRLEFPGAIYHITARGNAQQPIFLNDQDKKLFFNVVGQTIKSYNALCHAYCLMTNHYHLMIETPDGNLSQVMKQLNGIYTQWFNRRNRCVGHVFQGRFKSIVVDKDSYLLQLCRYIVLNPVRAGMVAHPGEYPWSSYNATSGATNVPELLSTDWILEQFGNHRESAQAEYRRFVAAGIGEESPLNDLKGQCLLGGKKFLE